MSGGEKYPLRGRWEKDVAASELHRRARGTTSVFRLGTALVISNLLDMEAPDGSGDSIAQWHVSVSDYGHRPSPKLIEQVRRDFGMQQAEIDNHHPGVAVHLMLVVDPARRVDCECKVGEQIVTEPDGYQWSNDTKECRGCSYERTFGRPCPLHSKTRSE